uniref:Uncharacterized protein n=1 Tax=Rhizophagus irregularis (strain DAOM 181602 / DAOM 197198 / MUCL 43194) TaxID=747089 RepID=U9UVS7_RHIID
MVFLMKRLLTFRFSFFIRKGRIFSLIKSKAELEELSENQEGKRRVSERDFKLKLRTRQLSGRGILGLDHWTRRMLTNENIFNFLTTRTILEETSRKERLEIL